MGSYKETGKNILDKFGRRSGHERRVASMDSFSFERRKGGDRRKNSVDRRKSVVGRFWTN